MDRQSTTGPVKGTVRRMQSVLTLGRRNEHELMISALKLMYNGGGTSFEADVLHDIGIKCYPLELDQQPTCVPDMFFSPMSKDQHEVDLTDAETQTRFASRGAFWDERRLPDYMHQYSKAQTTCGILRCNFLGMESL
ncbi:hypothetical protein UA08_03808 [Talaromyces atroroseus]|uniref:Uncharacterized protein n=1 Tax=Talaromyces atroroseus TaxID=1441469 RepID=A0A225AKS0_TALAT|nr:hypothetical protein UA08_03808 [Talaromyces atroroseus]OKL61480.1 hypothetical protein UA08_03808 [Talaromyces atroroseus]